jgi:hypothetical protein
MTLGRDSGRSDSKPVRMCSLDARAMEMSVSTPATIRGIEGRLA